MSKNTDLYLESFKAPLLSEILARCVSYICGSMLAVLFAVAFYDDRLPFNVHIGGANLVFYMLAFGGAITICRFLIRADDPNYELQHPATHMKEMENCGHSLPANWKANPVSREVRDEVMHQFKHRSLVMLDEVVSVLWMPYYFFFFLPAQAQSKSYAEICQFLTQFSVTEEGIGDICSYSSFQIEEIVRQNYLEPGEHEKLLRSYHTFKHDLKLSLNESFESVQLQFQYQTLRGESLMQE